MAPFTRSSCAFYARALTLVALALTGCAQSQTNPPATLSDQPLARTGSPAHSKYRIVYQFGQYGGTGRGYGHPIGRLVEYNQVLYGATDGSGYTNGSVFAITLDGTARVAHVFGQAAGDGTYPISGLTISDGRLYGATENGGRRQFGTVYSINPEGDENVVYSFKGPPDADTAFGPLVLGSERSRGRGVLFGTSYGGGAGEKGTVYRVDAAGNEKVLHSFGPDGSTPQAPLTRAHDLFYGTTVLGGDHGFGMVYSVTQKGAVRVLYSFQNTPDGSWPSELTYVNGLIYGTTTYGGTYNEGAVFTMDRTGKERTLHSFQAANDGENPSSGLTYLNGTFYGVTSGGGKYGGGTLYRVSLQGKVTVLHEFGSGSDGIYGQDRPINVNGTLYGVTALGGVGGSCANGCGVLYSLKP